MTSDGSGPEEPPPRSPLRRTIDFVNRHPLAIVGVLALILAAANAWWILEHRFVGGLDPDEAGYLASSMRMQRSIDFGKPWLFPLEFLKTPNGPLVPLLSVPLLILGPRNPLTSMMIQPILMVFTAVAVAGTTRRLWNGWVAVVAGVVTISMPTLMLATQSYWLGLGAAATAAAAAWALVSSEGCTNRWTWAFGAAMGALLLSRSMTIGFVPGFVAAALIVRRPGWESLRRLAGAAALTLVIAGPWWAAQLQSTIDYLVGYGYGERAGLFGSGGPWDRLVFRSDRIIRGIGEPEPGIKDPKALLIAVGFVVGPILALWRWRSRSTVTRGSRDVAALMAIFGFGLAALVSTSNQGVWFELPIVVVALPVAAWGVRQINRWLALGLGTTSAVQTVLFALTTLWIAGPSEIHSHYEDGFAQYDERFSFDNRGQHEAAANDWERLNRDVAEDLKELDPELDGTTVFTVSGNMQLFNSNTVLLASEIDGWGPRIWIPDTTLADVERADDLTPFAEYLEPDPTERVLVIAEHDFLLFTPDRDVADFQDQAIEWGWVPTAEHEMPVGGTVTIYRHSDNLDG